MERSGTESNAMNFHSFQGLKRGEEKLNKKPRLSDDDGERNWIFINRGRRLRAQRQGTIGREASIKEVGRNCVMMPLVVSLREFNNFVWKQGEKLVAKVQPRCRSFWIDARVNSTKRKVVWPSDLSMFDCRTSSTTTPHWSRRAGSTSSYSSWILQKRRRRGKGAKWIFLSFRTRLEVNGKTVAINSN